MHNFTQLRAIQDETQLVYRTRGERTKNPDREDQRNRNGAVEPEKIIETKEKIKTMEGQGRAPGSAPQRPGRPPRAQGTAGEVPRVAPAKGPRVAIIVAQNNAWGLLRGALQRSGRRAELCAPLCPRAFHGQVPEPKDAPSAASGDTTKI